MGAIAGTTEQAKRLLITLAFESVGVLAQLSVLADVLRSLFEVKA
jgi:hypothetical protein